MFDIGWSELLVVGLVALIVVGPKELPGMMKRIGQMIRAAKNTASNFQRQFEQAMDEGEIGELKESVKGIRDDLDPHKIMGDVVGVDNDDDFDLDKWNEQILEDEKKRAGNSAPRRDDIEVNPERGEPLDRINEMRPLDEGSDAEPVKDIKSASSRQVS